MKVSVKKAQSKNKTTFKDSPGDKFRVVIVDENPLCRMGLRELLRKDDRFDVLAESDDSEAGLQVILDKQPDVAVLDGNLPGISAVEMASLIRTKNRGINPVILAQQIDERAFNCAISSGIKGYILKKNAGAEILDCIAAVARGQAYISSGLTDFLLRRGSRTETLSKRNPGLIQLTCAERRVLKYIAQGKTSREIAAECAVSPRTVDSHRAHICEKLNLRGRNRLIHFALEHRDALSHID